MLLLWVINKQISSKFILLRMLYCITHIHVLRLCWNFHQNKSDRNRYISSNYFNFIGYDSILSYKLIHSTYAKIQLKPGVRYGWITIANIDPCAITYSVHIDHDIDPCVVYNFMPYDLEKNHWTTNTMIQMYSSMKI